MSKTYIADAKSQLELFLGVVESHGGTPLSIEPDFSVTRLCAPVTDAVAALKARAAEIANDANLSDHGKQKLIEAAAKATLAHVDAWRVPPSYGCECRIKLAENSVAPEKPLSDAEKMERAFARAEVWRQLRDVDDTAIELMYKASDDPAFLDGVESMPARIRRDPNSKLPAIVPRVALEESVVAEKHAEIRARSLTPEARQAIAENQELKGVIDHVHALARKEIESISPRSTAPTPEELMRQQGQLLGEE